MSNEKSNNNEIKIKPIHKRLKEILKDEVTLWTRRLGVTDTAIRNWFKGSYPGVDKLLKMHKFGLDINYILFGGEVVPIDKGLIEIINSFENKLLFTDIVKELGKLDKMSPNQLIELRKNLKISRETLEIHMEHSSTEKKRE